MKDIAELLRQQPFTEGLENEVIELMAGCATNVVYQANEYIFREGDPSDYFYLIRHGTVALEMFLPGRGAHNFHRLTSTNPVKPSAERLSCPLARGCTERT